jgi:hypothetical protein
MIVSYFDPDVLFYVVMGSTKGVSFSFEISLKAAGGNSPQQKTIKVNDAAF